MSAATGEGVSGETARSALDYARSIIDTVREPLLILDGKLRVRSANRSFYRTFRVSSQETEGKLLYDLGNGQWDIPRLRTLLEEILPRNTTFDDYDVEHDFPDIGRKVMLLNARRLRQEGTELILLAIEEVTERRQAEAERQEIESRFTSLVKNIKDHSVFTLDPEGRVTSWNIAAEQVLGYSEAEVLGRDFAFIFTPEDRELGLPEAELRVARESGRAEDERWHLRKDGERFWALGIVSALRDADGRLTGFSKILRDMTQWKQAEQAVREGEERLAFALQTSQIGAWELDLVDHTAHRSPEYDRIFGYEQQPPGWTYETFLAHVVPEDRAMVDEKFRHATANGRDWSFDCRIRRVDGEVRWIWATGRNRLDAAGRAHRLAGIVQDITDRKQAEAALREREERLELVWRATRDTIWDWDIEHDQQRWSDAGAESFGWTDAIEAPQTAAWWTERVYGDDRERVAEAFSRALEDPTCERWQDEYRFLRRDGSVADVLDRGIILRDDSGRPRRMIGAMQDITALKAAEAERERLLSEARLERDRLSALLTSMPDEVWYADTQGRFALANPAALNEFGLTLDEPVKVANLVAGLEVQRADGSPRPIEDSPALRALKGELIVNEEEVVRTPASGALRYRQVSAMPVRDQAGQIMGSVAVVRDITERKLAEEALQEADRRKNVFLATLAHELRNPLMPIRTGLDLLERLRGDAAACEEPLRIMDRQFDHLVHLVDDLMDVSRISRGIIELRRQRCDLAEIVQAALEMAEGQLGWGERHLCVGLPSQPLAVDGDRVRLVQVLANLLNNAVKFTDTGGHIALRVVPHGERVEIIVEDDGHGVDPRRLDDIFEMFAQAEPGQGAGLGIGLNLVRSLVAMHGGSVTAASDGVGHGATFTVSLPLCQSEPEQSVAPAAPAAASVSQARVLVVDDNRDIAEGLRLLLNMLGAEVRVALDGRAALRACDEWSPSHVLMDLGMPGMDGYETARRLCADHPDRAFRLIAVSGWGQDEDRRRSREAGFDEHLVKPVGVAALKALLAGEAPAVSPGGS